MSVNIWSPDVNLDRMMRCQSPRVPRLYGLSAFGSSDPGDGTTLGQNMNARPIHISSFGIKPRPQHKKVCLVLSTCPPTTSRNNMTLQALSDFESQGSRLPKFPTHFQCHSLSVILSQILTAWDGRVRMDLFIIGYIFHCSMQPNQLFLV